MGYLHRFFSSGYLGRYGKAIAASAVAVLLSSAYVRVCAAGDAGVGVASRVAPGVVCVKVKNSKNLPITGSGFFVAPGWVASSAHQVDSADNGYVVLNNGRKFKITNKIVDKAQDLALLKVEGSYKNYLRLSPEVKSVRIGQSVFTIGCPYGLDHSLSRGVISHEGRMLNGRVLIQTDVPVSKGSSGGALMNNKGEVVGVFHGVLQQSQAISFVVPVMHLSKKLSELGLLKALEQHESKNGPPATADSRSVAVSGSVANAETTAPANAELLWVQASNTTNPQEKIDLYKQVVELAPDMVKAHYNLGLTYFGLGQYAQAEETFAKALSIKDDYYQALVNLSLAQKMQGKLDDAKTGLMEAISLKPEEGLAYYNLGVLYEDEVKDKVSALRVYDQYLKIAPQGGEAKEIRKRQKRLKE